MSKHSKYTPEERAERKRRASREHQRRWRKEHPEEAREKFRIAAAKYRAKDPKAANDKNRARREANREKYLIKERAQYQRKLDKDPNYHRRTLLRLTFGITIEAYDERLKQQNNCCAICHKPPGKRRLAVDHDHDTGHIRGLLCGKCNSAIGLFEEDQTVMATAIAYLNSALKENT